MSTSVKQKTGTFVKGRGGTADLPAHELARLAKTPRPAWMSDPSKLPKAPPSRPRL